MFFYFLNSDLFSKYLWKQYIPYRAFMHYYYYFLDVNLKNIYITFLANSIFRSIFSYVKYFYNITFIFKRLRHFFINVIN